MTGLEITLKPIKNELTGAKRRLSTKYEEFPSLKVSIPTSPNELI
jgi:hypothetical protein